MVYLKNCLCIKLEHGGIFIAWLNTVSNVLVILFSIILIVISCILNCDKLNKLNVDEASIQEDKTDKNESCSTVRTIVIVILLFIIIVASATIIISYISITAIQNRNHFRITPFMMLLAIYTILLLLTVTIQLWLFPEKVLYSLIVTVNFGYMFLVIYSLYRIFRKEYERKVSLESTLECNNINVNA